MEHQIPGPDPTSPNVVRGFTASADAKGLLATDCTILGPRGQSAEGRALWDTGASGTFVRPELAERLGLLLARNRLGLPVTVRTAWHHGTYESRRVFIGDLIVPGGIHFQDVLLFEEFANLAALGLGKFDVLIGLPIITRGLFVVDGTGERVRFSFRVDKPVLMAREPEGRVEYREAKRADG